MKRLASQNYPENWESSCLWDGKLSIHLGYPSDGWILLSLLTTAYNGHLVIHCSDTFDPFWDLIDWLKAIADGRLPASFKINEEGQYKELVVRPYCGRFSEYSDIEFRINGDYRDDETKEIKEGCYFLARARRSQLLDQFTRRLEQWLREDYDFDGWNRGREEDAPANPYADLGNLDIGGLKAKIRAAQISKSL
jgi:hypothetical protein